MNNIAEYLAPNLVFSHIDNVDGKKQALEFISSAVSDADRRLKENDILTALLNRERLGSTAIGYGVAIPHARISQLKKPMIVCLTLTKPIEFDSQDRFMVDLIFGLLVPEQATEEHLNILSELSRNLLNPVYRDSLRQAISANELYQAAISETEIAVA